MEIWIELNKDEWELFELLRAQKIKSGEWERLR